MQLANIVSKTSDVRQRERERERERERGYKRISETNKHCFVISASFYAINN